MNSYMSNNRSGRKILSPEQYLILFFLFLGAMNFINRYYYWFFIAFFIFCLFISKIKFDNTLFPLLGLSLSIVVFSNGDSSLIMNIVKPFIYPLCYILGRGILKGFKSDIAKKQNETSISIIIIVLSLGLFVHLLLNLFVNFGSSNRNTIDFWTQTTYSATGQTALSCLPIAVICATLFSESKPWQKIISICALLLILFYNLILAGRTAFLFVVLCTILALAYLFFGTKERKFDFKAKLIIWMVVLIFLAVVLYSYNFLNIKNTIIGSNFYKRFFGKQTMEITEDSRFKLKMLYLKNMWGNFFGGSNIYSIVDGRAHDLFLDTYDYAGIFALISVIAYIIFSLKNFWCCILNKSIDFKIRQLILCIYFICYMEFMIEPILIGMQWFFAIFCFLDGMLYSYLDDNKKLLNSTKL